MFLCKTKIIIESLKMAQQTGKSSYDRNKRSYEAHGESDKLKL